MWIWLTQHLDSRKTHEYVADRVIRFRVEHLVHYMALMDHGMVIGSIVRCTGDRNQGLWVQETPEQIDALLARRESVDG